MSYSNVNDFLLAYPKLNTVGPDQIQAFLARGAAVIDSHIASVVALPVSPPAPPLLVQIEQDLAYVGLMKRNTMEASKDSVLLSIEKSAMALLRAIRDGKHSLLDSSGAELSSGPGSMIWSSAENYRPTFGVGDIDDAEVDPDRMDAEKDARG